VGYFAYVRDCHLIGDGRLVRVMRFADVKQVEATRDELQAAIRAWCNSH
jgi:crotonobetainyl-CoA:carnitine CoA-transferase CaiB-like acyl-CoA transferase